MNDVNAIRIVNRIIDDLEDRGGLQNAWEEIDEDTRVEIKARWREIVLAEANR